MGPGRRADDWNHAATFGANAFALVPRSPSLNITGSFTIESWVTTTSNSVVTVGGCSSYNLLVDQGRGLLQIGGITRGMGKKRINDGKGCTSTG
jgi:hypothetical protein